MPSEARLAPGTEKSAVDLSHDNGLSSVWFDDEHRETEAPAAEPRGDAVQPARAAVEELPRHLAPSNGGVKTFEPTATSVSTIAESVAVEPRSVAGAVSEPPHEATVAERAPSPPKQDAASPLNGLHTTNSQPASPGLPPADEDESSAVPELETAAMGDYEQLLGGYTELPKVRPGEICRGRVVGVSADGVVVDIGGKTEGLVPLDDFFGEAGDPQLPEGDDQEIDVFVERLGGVGEYAVLSYRRVRQSQLWEGIEECFRTGNTIDGKVVESVKGGLTVDIGLPAFMPASQADLRPAHDLDALVGETFPVRIVKVNKRRANIVVSRRALLEEELRERRQEALARLSLDAVVQGTVKNITDYGMFVDLGGIDALIHLTDLSWGRIQAPSEIAKPGDEITAKVIKLDAGKERVSLSIKHLTPDPWQGISERYHEGDKVSGTVSGLNDYGAFVEIEPGVEGLIHISEIGWSKRLRHPSKVYQIGQLVDAVVLKVDSEARRVSLSTKQSRPDPWQGLSERYPMGTVVEGRVRSFTSYGAFMEIEEGVEGMIHVSDLSWEHQTSNPREVLKKGRRTNAVVLHVDEENRRVSLGIKQLQPDGWEDFFSSHFVGDVIRGTVTQNAKFGAFVQLAPGVEGLCHRSEMPRSSNGKKNTDLRTGEEYSFRIVKIEEFDRKIGLTRRGMPQEPTAATPNEDPALAQAASGGDDPSEPARHASAAH